MRDSLKKLTCSSSPASVIPGARSASSILLWLPSPVSAVDDDERESPFLGGWVVGLRPVGTTLIGKLQETNRPDDRRLRLGWSDRCQHFVREEQHERRQNRRALHPTNSYVVVVNGTAGSMELSTNVLINVKLAADPRLPGACSMAERRAN